MPRRIVPEPDVKAYTAEQLRRIALKHKAIHGKLPYPEFVPETPLRKRNPSTLDLVWANRWNLVRHFIIGGSGAALATFTATKDVTAAGGAFIIGGIAGVTRKGFDDLRRVNGKPDGLTAIRNTITRTEGDGMGIRTEVGEFQAKLYDLVMLFFDETPDKEQVMDIAGGAWEAFNEAKDLQDISKDDMTKAGIDTALTMAASLKDKFIKYSDEVEVPE